MPMLSRYRGYHPRLSCWPIWQCSCTTATYEAGHIPLAHALLVDHFAPCSALPALPNKSTLVRQQPGLAAHHSTDRGNLAVPLFLNLTNPSAHLGLLSASMSTPPGRSSRRASAMSPRMAAGGHSCTTKVAVTRSYEALGCPVASMLACTWRMRCRPPELRVLHHATPFGADAPARHAPQRQNGYILFISRGGSTIEQCIEASQISAAKRD